MTNFEIYSLLLSGLNIAMIAVGFWFAYHQLLGAKKEINILNKHHADNHDWNRRKAAQDAIRAFDFTLLSKKFQTAFDVINRTEAIPMGAIDKAYEANPEIQMELHHLLNFYEGLSRGINQGLFDEEIIKTARRSDMIRCVVLFQNYLTHRRIEHPNAWSELSFIAHKWQGEQEVGSLRLAIAGKQQPKLGLKNDHATGV